ncbi:MAG: divergent polysaccharide deacetylase family protein [Rhizobiaceae bacterium]
MDDLHKPLGLSNDEEPNRPWIKPAMGAAAVCLTSLAAYVFIDARQATKTIVALNETVTVESKQKPNKQATKKSDASESEALPLDENGEIDYSKMKPLSPLEPAEVIDPQPKKQPVKPAFVPKKLAKKSASDWLPVPDLIEKSEFGPLPKVSSGNVRPLDAYSRSSGMIGANRVALVIGGLGLSQTGTQQAIEDLPSNITLGFSPFGNSLQRWMQKARKQGHEVILQLPMEPLGYPTIDPGPRTLNSKVPRGENLKNLRWSLARMTNYPLVMNYLGAGMSNKSGTMRPLLKEIRNRGLGYIDDGSVRASQIINIAKDISLPHIKGSVVIDAVREEAKIRASLRNLEALARQKGFALGTATAFPQTVAIIAAWVEEAQKRGILIVPASNLIKDYSP